MLFSFISLANSISFWAICTSDLHISDRCTVKLCHMNNSFISNFFFCSNSLMFLNSIEPLIITAQRLFAVLALPFVAAAYEVRSSFFGYWGANIFLRILDHIAVGFFSFGFTATGPLSIPLLLSFRTVSLAPPSSPLLHLSMKLFVALDFPHLVNLPAFFWYLLLVSKFLSTPSTKFIWDFSCFAYFGLPLLFHLLWLLVTGIFITSSYAHIIQRLAWRILIRVAAFEITLFLLIRENPLGECWLLKLIIFQFQCAIFRNQFCNYIIVNYVHWKFLFVNPKYHWWVSQTDAETEKFESLWKVWGIVLSRFLSIVKSKYLFGPETSFENESISDKMPSLLVSLSAPK